MNAMGDAGQGRAAQRRAGASEQGHKVETKSKEAEPDTSQCRTNDVHAAGIWDGDRGLAASQDETDRTGQGPGQFTVGG